MCGRFYIESEDPVLRDFLEQVNRSPLAARFRERNRRDVPDEGEITPAAVVPVVALNRNRERKVFPMKWGFSVPNPAGKSRLLINARTETAAEKPLFRESWTQRRCAVPASRYFEWEHPVQPDGRKRTGQKYAIRPREPGTVWLAGLYRMEEGLPAFTILTRAACGELSWMHDRMPLMLPEAAVGEWISPGADPEKLREQAVVSVMYEFAK